MKFRSALIAAAVTGSVFAAATASAAVTVTLNPGANNGGGAASTISAGTPAFQTTGGTLTLGSAADPAVLTIGATSGTTTFSEMGQIQLQSFTNAALISGFNSSGTVPNTNLNVTYGIFVDFMFSGFGSWVTPNQFQAAAMGSAFSGNIFAMRADSTVIQLGTLSLLPTATAFGIATTALAPVNGGTGTANTTFSASLNFNPAPGTTGANGFFQAPSPFIIDIALGSVGGNSGNTTYSVSETGVVTITTPSAGTSPSTGNFTFVSDVPEPGILSLAGIALLGLAAVTTRRKSRVAA